MINIIGVDCAAQYNKTGITYLKYEENSCKCSDIKISQGLKIDELLNDLENKLQNNQKNLLCFDTPLG